MEKKQKRKWIVIASIIACAIILLLIGAYIAVNCMFSAFTDSFYQTAVQESPIMGETKEPDEEDLHLSEFPEDFAALEKEKAFLTHLSLTEEEFRTLNEKISFTDKVNVLNLLKSGLDSEEYKELLAMLSNGITRQEIRRAYTILKQSLSSEDKEKVLAYYNKYINLIKE